MSHYKQQCMKKGHYLQLVTLEVGQKSGHSTKLIVGWAVVLTLCDSMHMNTRAPSLSRSLSLSGSLSPVQEAACQL
jgi:hypothetical protein